LGLKLVLLIGCAMGIQISEAADFLTGTPSASVSHLKIIDAIPQPDAGIFNSTRVHEDTSFAVLLETEHGIDLNDPDSIRFLISDGEFDPYERNLSHAAVRVVEVAGESSPATLIWAVYDRSLDPMLPPVYALDAIVNIFVEVEDLDHHKISAAAGHFKFKIESDGEQAQAFDHLPESVSFNIENSKTAVLGAVEVVYPQMAATVDGAVLAKMNERKQIKGCQLDGPLSLDIALDSYAAEAKGITDSPVAGDADILIAPDVETANGVYKAMSTFGKADTMYSCCSLIVRGFLSWCKENSLLCGSASLLAIVFSIM